MGNPVVIAFVPGTTASVLSNAAGQVWPRLLNPKLLKSERDILAGIFETVSDLSVDDLVSDYPLKTPVPCYESLINYFTGTLQFQRFVYSTAVSKGQNHSFTPDPGKNLFFCVPYDFRQDNVSSATWLNNALSYIDAAYGSQAYDLYLFAHSMGGLVSRYLLENGATVKHGTWASKLKTLVTFGTPHLGAPLALAPMVDILINSNETPDEGKFLHGLVNSTKFPSTYELLPPEGHPFVSDPQGNLYDLFKTSQDSLLGKLLGTMGFSWGNLTTAGNFFSGLNYAGVNSYGLAYHCMVGTGLPTVADAPSGAGAYLYTPASGSAAATLTLSPAAGDGDGIVPAGSASFAGAGNVSVQTFPGYNHGQLAGSDMTDHPDAILAALKIAGITVTAREPAHA